MSAHWDCCSRPRDFGQMVCSEHIASFWCFRYDKQGNSPVGGKIDLVIQLRGAAEIDFQKERRNDETKTAISFLAFAMTAGLLTVGAGAAGPAYGDNAGHWAEGSIGRWSEHGIVQGGNGAFAPNAPIARERAMVILGCVLGIESIENPDLTKYADAAQVVSNNLLSQLVSVE